MRSNDNDSWRVRAELLPLLVQCAQARAQHAMSGLVGCDPTELRDEILISRTGSTRGTIELSSHARIHQV